MSLFLFLSVLQAIVAAALVGVVLMQRSEGGGLGIGGGGGGPGGLMSARGAADFLTQTTKWLAVAFVVLAIVLAAVAVDATTGRELDDSLDRSVTPSSDPLAPVSGTGAAPTQTAPAQNAPAEAAPAPGATDPLADVAE